MVSDEFPGLWGGGWWCCGGLLLCREGGVSWLFGSLGGGRLWGGVFFVGAGKRRMLGSCFGAVGDLVRFRGRVGCGSCAVSVRVV